MPTATRRPSAAVTRLINWFPSPPSVPWSGTLLHLIDAGKGGAIVFVGGDVAGVLEGGVLWGPVECVKEGELWSTVGSVEGASSVLPGRPAPFGHIDAMATVAAIPIASTTAVATVTRVRRACRFDPCDPDLVRPSPPSGHDGRSSVWTPRAPAAALA